MDYNLAGSELHEWAGLTQTQLANTLGVTQSTVSKFERGEMLPDLTGYRMFCDAVGMTIPDFAQLLESRFKSKSSS